MRRLALVLTAALALGACHGAKKAPRGQPPVPVRVAAAERIDAPITITASGVVEPMQTVSVQAQVSGALHDVAFAEGSYVREGQLLFRIDERSFAAAAAQARAALARDEAKAAAARRSDVRYQTLAAEDYDARAQADQVHAAALAAAATVAADRAALHAAEVDLGYTTIRAPISGRTGAINVRTGDIVGPGTGPLVVINQLQPVLVRFPVLAQDLPLLQSALASHPLPVTVSAVDSSGAVEQGQLTFLDNAVDSTTGTVTGKARLENAGSRFWPGELVFLSVRAGTQPRALVVPTAAVLLGQQGSYVYIVDPRTGVAQSRNIATGRTVGELTVVESGLKDGERVVTDGQGQLTPGAKVAIVAGQGGGAGADAARGGPASAVWSGVGPGGAAGPGTEAGAGAGAAAAVPPLPGASRGTGAGTTGATGTGPTTTTTVQQAVPVAPIQATPLPRPPAAPAPGGSGTSPTTPTTGGGGTGQR
jgi:multidrug efflux system membrane fusion protein